MPRWVQSRRPRRINRPGRSLCADPVPSRCRAAGISRKTQELYFLVFITRYLDLFTSFISWCAATRLCAHMVLSGTAGD